MQGALYTVQSSDKNIHPLQGVLYTLQSTDKNVYLMQGVVHTIQSTKKCIPCARCAVQTPSRVQKKVSTLCKVCCTNTVQSTEKSVYLVQGVLYVHRSECRKNVYLMQGVLYTVLSTDKNVHPYCKV